MKTIKLHRTASVSWRLLVDGKVHPLLVGMLTLRAVVDKLILVHDIVGPFDDESLLDLEADLAAAERHGITPNQTPTANCLNTAEGIQMKTIKLHRTASQTWRLLVNEQVHPLMVGMITLTATINKLVLMYDVLGPFTFESLQAMEGDLKMYLERIWAHTDTAFEDVTDTGNARLVLGVKMLKWYSEEMKNDIAAKGHTFILNDGQKFSDVISSSQSTNVDMKGVHIKGSQLITPKVMMSTSELISRKHHPTDEELVEQIRHRNPINPNLRLTKPSAERITYGILMDNKQGEETWLIGAAYDKRKAEAYLKKIKTMFEKAAANQKE